VNTIELHAALIESPALRPLLALLALIAAAVAAAGRGVGSGMSVSWDRGSVQAGASCRFSI
jgi:hypothetical protein